MEADGNDRDSRQPCLNTHCRCAAEINAIGQVCCEWVPNAVLIDLNVSVTLMVMPVTDTIVMYTGRIRTISCEDDCRSVVI